MAMSIARQYARKVITECLPRKRWDYAWWNEALIAYTAVRVATEVGRTESLIFFSNSDFIKNIFIVG